MFSMAHSAQVAALRPKTTSVRARPSARSQPRVLAYTEPSNRSAGAASAKAGAAAKQASTVNIICQGHGVAVTDAIRQYAEDKVSKVCHPFEAEVSEVDVHISVRSKHHGQHGPDQHSVSLVAYTLRNGVLRVEDKEDSMYAAIDLATDKLKGVLRKTKEKAIKRGKWPGRGGKGGPTAADEGLGAFEEAGTNELLEAVAEPLREATDVREKFFKLHAISQAQAIEELEESERDFYLYHDRDAKDLRVLYRLKRGQGYGVVVPSLAQGSGPNPTLSD
ncbi:unnamed protein product [Pedinophyceae sp. YPF-701]|nr:unnamed protein product [Pedinophyceae sp. YPF-701]